MKHLPEKQQEQAAILCNHLQSRISDNTESTSLDKPGLTASYTLGTNQPWPDLNLNRILATIDSFNTDDLNEIECLEMLLYLSSRRCDVRVLAEAAIKTYGSLNKLFTRPGKELRETLGFDHSMTAVIAIAKTSLRSILACDLTIRHDLKSYSALIEYLAFDLRHAEQEVLRVIYLDTKCRIIRDEEMARGTIDAVSIYPREIAKRTATYCASSIILAHNHLSDDPTPSSHDIEATLKTKYALECLDVILHDHVIIARQTCFSKQHEGLI